MISKKESLLGNLPERDFLRGFHPCSVAFCGKEWYNVKNMLYYAIVRPSGEIRDGTGAGEGEAGR